MRDPETNSTNLRLKGNNTELVARKIGGRTIIGDEKDHRIVGVRSQQPHAYPYYTRISQHLRLSSKTGVLGAAPLNHVSGTTCRTCKAYPNPLWCL